jgi:hypothetical protein
LDEQDDTSSFSCNYDLTHFCSIDLLPGNFSNTHGTLTLQTQARYHYGQQNPDQWAKRPNTQQIDFADSFCTQTRPRIPQISRVLPWLQYQLAKLLCRIFWTTWRSNCAWLILDIRLYTPRGNEGSTETDGVDRITTSRTRVHNAIILCSYDGSPHNEVDFIRNGLWSGT